MGLTVCTLAFLCSAYDEEELGRGGDVRTVLHFHPALAPVKIGVLPLSKKLNEAQKDYPRLVQDCTTVSLMTEVTSVNVTVVRMRSVLLLCDL